LEPTLSPKNNLLTRLWQLKFITIIQTVLLSPCQSGLKFTELWGIELDEITNTNLFQRQLPKVSNKIYNSIVLQKAAPVQSEKRVSVPKLSLAMTNILITDFGYFC
jgi:hypothetical protein